MNIDVSDVKRPPLATAKIIWRLLFAVQVIAAAFAWRSQNFAKWPFDSTSADRATTFFCALVALAAFIAYAAMIHGRWDHVHRLPSRKCVLALVAGLLIGLWCAIVQWPLGSLLGCCVLAGCWLHSHVSRVDAHPLLEFLPPMISAVSFLAVQQWKLGSALATEALQLTSIPVLDWMNIPFQQSGDAFLFSHGAIQLRTLATSPTSFLIVFAALLMVAWFRRPIISLPFYVLFALAWASLINVIQVAASAVALSQVAQSASMLPRVMTLLVSTFIAALLLASTDRLLRIVFLPIPDTEKSASRNPLTLVWNRWFERMADTASSLAPPKHASSNRKSDARNAKPSSPNTSPGTLTP